jgi:hypothetical protein
VAPCMQADCFILGPRTGPGYKRPIQLDMAALGLGKVGPALVFAFVCCFKGDHLDAAPVACTWYLLCTGAHTEYACYLCLLLLTLVRLHAGGTQPGFTCSSCTGDGTG